MGFLEKLFGPSVPNITATELSDKLKFGKHPLVLDVRQPDEFRQGHIRGAKLLSLNEIYKRMGELSKGREIVCICATGNRSRSASKILAKEGFTVANVQGGMLAWRRAKLPIQKG
ncbi:MAG: rhodanese-like domain-containing protein [Anaerolineales bacterium]|jgi:rhodanese-related sulfurtransferase|nr:rhodanese-like domain-containing protein [Anaerolineales bacterium]